MALYRLGLIRASEFRYYLNSQLTEYEFQVLPPCPGWMLGGAEVDIHVAMRDGSQVNWERLAGRITDIPIPTHYVRMLPDSIQVTMAHRLSLNNYQTHRVDRGVGSLTHSLNTGSLFGTFTEGKTLYIGLRRL